MPRITVRDLVWFPVVVFAFIGWGYDHSLAAKRERESRALQLDLALAAQRHAELAERLQQRLDEYENQHELLRRLLRLPSQEQN